MRRICFIFLFFVSAVPFLYSQTSVSGNLLKITLINSDYFLFTETGHWIDSSRYTPDFNYFIRKEYYGYFQLNGHNYLLAKAESYYDSRVMTYYYGAHLLVNENTDRERKISGTNIGMDFMTPYMIDKTEIVEAYKGNWLINGYFGSSFIKKDDNLNAAESPMEGRFLAIPGFVNGKPLAVFAKNFSGNNFDYYFISLADTSKIDPQNLVKVQFTDTSNSVFWDNPLKIKNLKNDLYFIQKERRIQLDIYKFENNSFYPVKILLKNYFDLSYKSYEWDFRNNKLYLTTSYMVNYRLFDKLVSFDYNAEDTSLVNERILVDSLVPDNYSFDRNFRNLAIIDTNSAAGKVLKIFNLDKVAFTHSISLKDIDTPSRPFIDSPYVFIHQVKHRYTGVNTGEVTAPGSYKLSAYPNPFNSSVKIFYSLPEDKEIELSIYDMLGRKVKILSKGFEKKGSHEVIFNAEYLSSGIYLYNLSTDNYRKTNKIMLMK